MIRHVFFPIRLATANDFKTADGKAFLGKVYFVQNSDLTINKKLHYLNEQTDQNIFKALFDDSRIFVFENPNEVLKVDECTLAEWNEIFPPAIQNQETIEFPVEQPKAKKTVTKYFLDKKGNPIPKQVEE